MWGQRDRMCGGAFSHMWGQGAAYVGAETSLNPLIEKEKPLRLVLLLVVGFLIALLVEHLATVDNLRLPTFREARDQLMTD